MIAMLSEMCIGYLVGCLCPRCINIRQKCARAGCINKRLEGSEFCLSCKSAVTERATCDNLTSVFDPAPLPSRVQR